MEIRLKDMRHDLITTLIYIQIYAWCTIKSMMLIGYELDRYLWEDVDKF
jgi:hypothetical protein